MIEGFNGFIIVIVENLEVLFFGFGDYSIILMVSNGYCELVIDISVLFIQQLDMVVLELLLFGFICDVFDLVFLIVFFMGGFWMGVGIDFSGVFDFVMVGLGVYSL